MSDIKAWLVYSKRTDSYLMTVYRTNEQVMEMSGDSPHLIFVYAPEQSIPSYLLRLTNRSPH